VVDLTQPACRPLAARSTAFDLLRG